MGFSESINEIIQLDIPAAFERFGRTLDGDWIIAALAETGTASVRRRKIPAQLVVWLVIGMALFRDRAIEEVTTHLGLVLPSQKNQRPAAGRTVTSGAIPKARARLGPAPLKAIFQQTAVAWSQAAADMHRWHGLSLYGLDGTTFRIPDTDDNREAFGLPPSSRGQASYPQVRLVALMALRSHLLTDAAFGPYSGKETGEHSLARELWLRLPDLSLVIIDRGFIDYGLFSWLSHDEDGSVHGRKHWLVRAKKNLRWKTLEVFAPGMARHMLPRRGLYLDRATWRPAAAWVQVQVQVQVQVHRRGGKCLPVAPGDELVELSISSQARDKDPSLPKKMVVRAIRYQVKGYRPQTLLTSMIDPKQYPAKEVAELYHERWELELGYDEVKTHMLEREEALRSKKADGIRQEIWGILLAYNLVRKEMLDVAEAAGVAPVRVSFRHSLMLIRVFCTVDAWTCEPGVLPKRLASLLETMASLLILPERRSERRYKRRVEIKMSSYKRNPGRPLAKGSK